MMIFGDKYWKKLLSEQRVLHQLFARKYLVMMHSSFIFYFYFFFFEGLLKYSHKYNLNKNKVRNT